MNTVFTPTHRPVVILLMQVPACERVRTGAREWCARRDSSARIDAARPGTRGSETSEKGRNVRVPACMSCARHGRFGPNSRASLSTCRPFSYDAITESRSSPFASWRFGFVGSQQRSYSSAATSIPFSRSGSPITSIDAIFPPLNVNVRARVRRPPGARIKPTTPSSKAGCANRMARA
jgi:hypothetical protein